MENRGDRNTSWAEEVKNGRGVVSLNAFLGAGGQCSALPGQSHAISLLDCMRT